MPVSKYTYFANVEFSDHYANQLTLTLDDDLSTILMHFYKHTYYQPYPSVFKYFLEETCCYSAKNTFIKNPTKPSRSGHGALHANHVAIAAVIFFKLYEKYGSDKTQAKIDAHIATMPGKTRAQKRAYFLKLLQIAAAFHDTGRLGDGKDREIWEMQGSNDCQLFIAKLLTNSQVASDDADNIARFFAQAVCFKDDKLTLEKSLVHSCIQAADCLDIMRCKENFGVNRLDIWMDAMGFRDNDKEKVIETQKSAQLQKELFYLVHEWQEVLRKQGGFKHRTKIELQSTHKTRAEHFYFHKRKQSFQTTLTPNFDRKQRREMLKLADLVTELEGDDFPLLAQYYLEKQDAHSPLLKPLDDAISQYVAFQQELMSKIPIHANDPCGLNNATLALIHLRYKLKNSFLVEKIITREDLNIIQNETVSLIASYQTRLHQPEQFGTDLTQYHQKMSAITASKAPYLAAAAAFLVAALTIPFIYYSILAFLIIACTSGLNTSFFAANFTAIFTTHWYLPIGMIISGVDSAFSGFLNHPKQQLKRCINEVESHFNDLRKGIHTSLFQYTTRYSMLPQEPFYERYFVRV